MALFLFSSMAFALDRTTDQAIKLVLGSDADFKLPPEQPSKDKQEHSEDKPAKDQPKANQPSQDAQPSQAEQPTQTMTGEAAVPNNGNPQTTEKPAEDFIRGY